MSLPARTVLALLLAAASASQAQWRIQTSNTTAGLRGIHAVSPGIAWASGTEGAVLHTTDGGATWQPCAIPPGAEHLDFRGVQAFDANTAIVMSSGKGDLSRLYKTTDACQTWKLVFTNPDAEGFWDAVVASVAEGDLSRGCPFGSKVFLGTILGDPALHKSNQWDKTPLLSFYLADFEVGITCQTEQLGHSVSSIFASPGQAAFAASNSVVARLGPDIYWIAANTQLIQYLRGFTNPGHYEVQSFCDMGFPVSRHSPSAGVFSLAIKPGSVEPSKAIKIPPAFSLRTPSCQKAVMVVVGGDYTAVDDPQDTAAFTAGKNKFLPAETPPHGYRSAVAYDPTHKAWITVGPNGTDLSTDDGRTWRPLKPAPTDASDADRHWNALSLPFVVGPNGRIGRLNESALPH